jgi:hypothetical protein
MWLSLTAIIEKDDITQVCTGGCAVVEHELKKLKRSRLRFIFIRMMG